jgi:hypothetical protein
MLVVLLVALITIRDVSSLRSRDSNKRVRAPHAIAPVGEVNVVTFMAGLDL